MDDARGETATRDQIAGYLRGDQSAERALFDRHRRVLEAVARRHRAMPFLEHHVAVEDLANETFARALISGFFTTFEDRGPGSLRNGLVTILECVINDWCRRLGAGKRFIDTHARTLGTPPESAGRSSAHKFSASPPPSPTSEARASELLEMCRKALTPREWAVWTLSQGNGLESPEIAAALQTSSSAIRGLLRRARMRVSEALCRLHDGPD